MIKLLGFLTDIALIMMLVLFNILFACLVVKGGVLAYHEVFA